MHLSDLKIHEVAIVMGSHPEPAMARRLWDLGFTKGTRVEAVQASPSGDPVAYRVRGTIFAIRKKDAQEIEVEKVLANGTN